MDGSAQTQDEATETGDTDSGSAPAASGLGTALLAGAAAALAGCGGGTSQDDAAAQVAGLTDATRASPTAARSGADSPATTSQANATTRNELTATIVRFLLQAQFSAPDADIVFVRTQGYDAWLAAQFNGPRSEGGYDWLVSSGNTNPMNNQFFWPQFADFMIWKQLITSPDQMRQRLALALSEMFVVSTSALDAFWPGSFMGAYWDLLVKGAFGNFRTLLEDITLNAAMGRYLNTLGNQMEDPATGRLPDENYAREVMQLFTIGLVQLNPDGTPKLGPDGRPIDSYTQADVSNLARVFTGYVYDYTGVTYTTTPFQPYPIPSPENARNRMRLDPARHSSLAATFLGITVPANTPGATALRIALDGLFNHPNVGPFLARQMIQRLVTSNPSPAYVRRVAAAFDDNGSGVRGDMKAFWKVLLLDPEARTLPTAPTAGKLREPIVRAVQWARTFNAGSPSGKWVIYDQSSSDYGLSQSPLRSPSVFNFFRPGYVPPRTALSAAGLVAPEFQLHNESSTVGYVNYLTSWISGSFGYDDVKADYSEMLPMAHDAATLLAWLNMRLTAYQLTDATVRAIYSSIAAYAVTATSPVARKLNRIHAAILLVMASPEYIVQK